MLDRHLVRLLPLVPTSIVHRVAKRYVAGENSAQALAATAALNGSGCAVTLALLGEHLQSRTEIETVVEHYLGLLDGIEERALQATISVKPTHVGLGISAALCHDNLHRLAEAVERHSSFLRIDMEDHRTTDDTLDVFARLHSRFDCVGVVLQAYLHRTMEDVQRLPAGASVRLCKGIYPEPEGVAVQDYQEIRESFLRILDALLRRDAPVAVATHDDYLIERGEAMIRDRGLQREAYEFQMLLGVRPRLRQTLLARGHRLRVYVPFGPDWYAYSMRRLKENPLIAGHIVRALVGRR